jgi:hypothetical protein
VLQSAFEVLNAFTQTFCDLRDFLAAKQKHGNDENDQKFRKANRLEHSSSLSGGHSIVGTGLNSRQASFRQHTPRIVMKRKKFDVKKEVKAIARERVGSPKPARVLNEKENSRHPKHKKPILPPEKE